MIGHALFRKNVFRPSFTLLWYSEHFTVSDWLQTPRLILHNQLALRKSWRWLIMIIMIIINNNNHYNYYYFHYKYKYNLKSLDSIKQKQSAQTTNRSTVFYIIIFFVYFLQEERQREKKKDLKHTVSQTEQCMLYGNTQNPLGYRVYN